MDWIPVGRVTKVHGLKGELKFRSLSESDTWITKNTRILLSCNDFSNSSEEYFIQSIRGKGTPLIIKFKKVDNLESAKELVGHTLHVLRSQFPDLPEGEYYWFQIEGLKVYDEDGTYYGNIMKIIQTGSNDVYVVHDEEKELLLPMIDSVVKKIDLKAGKLIFRPVEGLLEDTPV